MISINKFKGIAEVEMRVMNFSWNEGYPFAKSGGMGNVSQYSKIPFYHIVGSVTISSFCWCNACLCWWFSLLSADLYFFPYFLSPSLKSIIWPSLLSVFQLQSLFFLFLIFGIDPFVKVLFVFNFIFYSHFTKYYIL
jgi:hypothetical protein